MKKYAAVLLLSLFVLSLSSCDLEIDSLNDVVSAVESVANIEDGELNDVFSSLEIFLNTAEPDSDTEYANVPDEENSISWTIGNVTYYYTHDGSVITGYINYIKYDSDILAKEAYKALKAANDSDGKYQSVDIDDCYVILVHRDTDFGYDSLEELRVAAGNFKATFN